MTRAVATLTAGAEVWSGSAGQAAPSVAAVASRFDVADAPLAPGTLTLRPAATDPHAVSSGPAAAYTHPPAALAAAYDSGDAATGLGYTAVLAPVGTTGLRSAVTVLAGRSRLAGFERADIPVPLHAYPVPPVLLGQAAGATFVQEPPTLAGAPPWTWHVASLLAVGMPVVCRPAGRHTISAGSCPSR
ncbi:hypothetical protein [Streptomyces sp. NBC_00073]|uniref:hypothetical protein n=1 Tax=Streptomyces sp. NBC_00073 TaxID=2975640 RepID=UPI0032507696